jgi:hypothetical protein
VSPEPDRVLSFPAIVRPGIEQALPPPPVTVLFLGTRPLKRRLEPVEMSRPGDLVFRPPGKPLGGLWTCREDARLPGYSPWLQHSVGRSRVRRRHTRLWRLVAPAPRLLTIDSVEALSAAMERYPHDEFAGLPRHLTGEIGREPDHAAIAADGYDGIEVTEAALHRIPLSEREFHLYVLLSGWDVPTILWYRWAFRGPATRVDDPIALPGLDDDDDEDDDDEA